MPREQLKKRQKDKKRKKNKKNKKNQKKLYSYHWQLEHTKKEDYGPYKWHF